LGNKDGLALGIGNRSIAAARRTLRLHSSRRLRRRGCGRQPGKDFGLDEIVSGYSDYLDSAGNGYKLDNTKEYHYADGLGRNGASLFRPVELVGVVEADANRFPSCLTRRRVR
jgi:hypothetical protein